jgi:hypothetical protein
VKQLRIVCGTTTTGSSLHPAKIIDSNGRHTPGGSSSTNGQQIVSNKKTNENRQQNGSNEKINRHRPSGASAMNARDPLAKQKMSNVGEPGPLKRAQGKINYTS